MSKSIVFVRHGLSKMNVALGRQPWGSPGFVDPDIRDAPLEPSGLAGARALREPLARDAADVELVVSSPLTRALATADAAFDAALTSGVPALALPLAAERCYMTSDVWCCAETTRQLLSHRWRGRLRFDLHSGWDASIKAARRRRQAVQISTGGVSRGQLVVRRARRQS